MHAYGCAAMAALIHGMQARQTCAAHPIAACLRCPNAMLQLALRYADQMLSLLLP